MIVSHGTKYSNGPSYCLEFSQQSHTTSLHKEGNYMSISSIFTTTAKFFCATGMIISMWFIYSAVYLAHCGTPEQVVDSHLATWVFSLTPIEQLILVASTPFIGAIVGGIGLGIVIYCLIRLIVTSIKGFISWAIPTIHVLIRIVRLVSLHSYSYSSWWLYWCCSTFSLDFPPYPTQWLPLWRTWLLTV